MKKKVCFSAIKEEWKAGRIVVAEIGNEGNFKARAVIQKTLPKQWGFAETIYGTVKPKELYSFDNAVEAQKFINEK